MPFNGTGMFVRVRNWVADAAAGVKIRADYHDIEDDGFAAGLSDCITKDGQTTIMNNIPMNGKRITALSDPVDPQDAVTKAYDDLKLPLAGGTITGNLNVTGSMSALGYKTRPGVAGALGNSLFNFNWTGNLQVWVDNTNLGDLATTAYVENRASAWAHAIADPKVNRAGDTMGGLLNTAASGSLGYGGSLNSIMVWGATNDWAAMSFHSPGAFGCNFGMHPNGNFYQGGWSFGAGVAYMFYTTRNLTPVTNGRLTYAGDQYTYGPGGNGGAELIREYYAGAVLTGLIARDSNNGADGGVVGGRWRYMQLLTPGGWFTVGYA